LGPRNWGQLSAASIKDWNANNKIVMRHLLLKELALF
jgi:hypothetical protein